MKGYEFYTHITRYLDKHGSDQAIDDFVALMPWGTPEQVLEKVAFIRDKVGIAGFTPNFSFAGMPAEDAERSVRLFAAEVLPELHTWDAEPVGMDAVAAKSWPEAALTRQARCAPCSGHFRARSARTGGDEDS